MKKVNQTSKMFAVAIIAIVTFANNVFAQPSGGALWQPLGSDTVQTSRNVKINRALRVLEGIIAETIDAKSIFANSIEVKNYLKVGDSAIWIVPFGPGISDDIRSDIGVLALMEGDNFTFSSNTFVGNRAGTSKTICIHLYSHLYNRSFMNV